MPLISKYDYEHFKLYLWDINETEKKLKAGVTTNSLKTRLSKIKSEEFGL